MKATGGKRKRNEEGKVQNRSSKQNFRDKPKRETDVHRPTQSMHGIYTAVRVELTTRVVVSILYEQRWSTISLAMYTRVHC